MENNYRIMIEPLNSEMEENFSDELRSLECEGFTVIAEQGDGTIVAVNHMNNLGIAKAIAGNTTLSAASRIAKGLREAAEIERKGKKEDFLSYMLRGELDRE